MSVLFGKALTCANDARFLFERGHYDGACDRAYFAVFNSARALLAARGLKVARLRRARTVCRLVSLTFGSTTRASELIETLHLADEVRRVAVYTEEAVAPATAERMLASMDQFMFQADEFLVSGEQRP